MIKLMSEPTTLAKLQESPFVFYLTGSRFFGTHSDNSDYDFFTQSNREVEIWLLDNGFYAIGCEKYSDISLLQVYAHNSEKIHIQIVLSAGEKFISQTLLKFTNQQRKFNAGDWNRAFDMINVIKGLFPVYP